MKKYYDTLEISQEASPSEIKKAYFKMVRMYSPEKNPEKFREIREAYEFLKNAEESGPSFPPLKEHGAELFLKQIQEYERRRNFAMFRNACEEAVRLFPEEIQFQYLLAVAQRKAGNTGKAVKSGEVLVKKDPENKWYWRELTMDYIERGFSRKAFPCIIKAFEMGCNDNDFLLTASIECRELGQIEESIKLLWALVRKDKRWKREEIPDVLEAYSGLCVIGKDIEEVQGEVLSALLEFLNEYPMYLEENIEILSLIVAVMVNISMNDKYNENLNKIIQTIRDNCHSEKFEQLLSENIRNRNLYRLCNDERFGDTIKSGVLLHYEEELDDELRTFFDLDSKLCMLKEQNEILSQLEILEKEYPIFYEQIRDFAEKLKSGKNLHYVKDSMQRQYAALTKYIDGGRYFELYPEEKIRSFGKVFYENDDFEPYVRTEKKIGRNDACPCGSGKKYKHCCMRKS